VDDFGETMAKATADEFAAVIHLDLTETYPSGM